MNTTKKIVYIALSTALIAVLTMFPKFPVANGYIHLGDSMIIFSAYILGLYAVPAAAIGSALADIMSGYAIYSMPTFVIKGAMAFVAYIIIGKKDNPFFLILASLACEAIMVAGYFLFDWLVFDIAVALTALLYSPIQAAGGAAIGVTLCAVTGKFGIKEKIVGYIGKRED